MTLDPRLNAYRADLADLALKDRVTAVRYTEGAPMRVVIPVAPLRREPADAAALDSEALHGEAVTVFERRDDGWSWVQLAADRYVGWMPARALDSSSPPPTHKVTALHTLVFSRPDIKSPPLCGLPLGAHFSAVGEAEDRNARYLLLAAGGAVVRQHAAPLEAREPDWTAVAERFLGVPYLWGGKTSLGIDCSGLVQVALSAAGLACPRDSDMQAAAAGVALEADLGALRRGDLVFWRGHVGIMRDGLTLLHGNAHHMQVAGEPLAEAVARFSARGLGVLAIRRPVAE